MSLLLDALKKAAEKKARKSAEQAQGIESTEIDHDSIQESERQPEEQLISAAGDAHAESLSDSTEIDVTKVDTTDIDATQVDKTDLDSTELDITDIADGDIDKTDIDSTDIKNTALDLTDIEATQVDRTELDITDIADSDSDTTDIDSTDIKTAALDMSSIEATQADPSEIDVSGHDHEESQAQSDLTDKHTLTEEDKTLLFYEDEGDDDAVEIAATAADGDKTETQITDTQGIHSRQPPPKENILTQDDVTEFMGDGLTAKEVEDNSIPRDAEYQLGTDDTTLTNRDSLSLTNIDYEDMSLEQQQDAGSEKITQPGYDDRDAFSQAAEEFELEDMSESGHTTISNADGTSSTIDIERLTSDETVTIKDSTSTRTFAPDNYDRTLLKLADSDVSRIFPGMKPETDTVMTPDYAKKVFLNKSQGVKHTSYKAYLGIALLILVTVSVLGLFELQDESDSIDRSLLGLKRDPMPGMIKPKSIEQTPILFPAESVKGDEKVIGLLANAEEGESGADELLNGLVEQQDINMAKPDVVSQETESVTLEEDSADDAGSSTADTMKSAATAALPVATQNRAATPEKQQPATSRSTVSDLKITSSSRVSEKDQYLASAYEAYAAGDITTAGRLYDQVLSLEPQNRDALLGRAATHIQENEAEKAIQYYQKLLESNPKDSMAMTSLISVVNIDPQAGESQIKNLLREQPDSPYLHFALGNMYGSQKRWVEAQSAYFKALQYKPGDPNYAYNLAVSLEHMHKPDSAITFYQRALENNSFGQATFDSQLVGQRIEVLSQ